jgi:Hypothetical glycosyl hydrolase family 15
MRSVAAWMAIGLLLGLVACTEDRPRGAPRGQSPSAGPDGDPSPPGQIFRTWAPANEREAAISMQDAVGAAAHFDLLVMPPSTDTGSVVEMRRGRPRLRLLVYMNGAFAQARNGDAYPDEWYARDADGAKIRSLGFGNWLMDVSVAGWARDRATTCMRLIADAGYDGCMLDLLGTAPLLPGYATGVPIDERTDEPWRVKDWLDATSMISGTVERRVRPAIVVGNGLGNGARFFDAAAPSSILLDGVHGGLAEAWLRAPREELDRYPSVSDWLLDVQMLSSAGGSGKTVLVLTKTWAPGSRQEKDRWHRFALASFLLGMEGSSYFHFSNSPHADPLQWHRWWDPDIGESFESYRVIDGLYRRRFARGLVLVNPTDGPVEASLSGSFTTLDGRRVQDTMVIPPHAGEILQTAGV